MPVARPAPALRRVVTGRGPDGRSRVLDSGDPPIVHRFLPPAGGADSHSYKGTASVNDHGPARPGESVIAELWATGLSSIENTDPTLALEEFDVETPPGCTKWRLVRMGPALEVPMHRTSTVDYDLVLAGEIELVLEDGSIRLGPGDMAILPGVAHGWKIGEEGVTMVITMVGVATDADGEDPGGASH